MSCQNRFNAFINNHLLKISVLFFIGLFGFAEAQVLDSENKISVVLNDGTQVILFGKAASNPGEITRDYYYLPVNLRISRRPDGTPSFLFLKFTTEKRADQGGISGALLHFLMEWGLTPQQDSELRAKVKRIYRDAEVKGPVNMEPVDEAGSFQIISGTLLDNEMTLSLVTSGKAPLIPGGKTATAARLDANAAQLLAATFEKNRSITDVSIALNFSYSTLTPAARGRVIFDWSRLDSAEESIKADYTHESKKHGWWIFGSTEHKYTYNEMTSHFNFLETKGVVKLEFDELVADERVAKIREAFFQYFLNAFTEPAESEVAPRTADEEEKEKIPNIRYGKSYKYKQSFIDRAFQRKVQTFDLAYRMAIRSPYQLVGNLAEWYDAVRNNSRNVSSVNLNDPFFDHRDILFILDIEAQEIFDEEINYVTVNVRKRRQSGNDFSDRITIDKMFLQKEGTRAILTYARGEDTNPDVFEYMSQWSLRGGLIYPQNAYWKKGSWEGVTLAPPIKPKTIEIEADLEDLKKGDITRVTAQIHYKKYDREVEENIHISPAKGEPLVSKKIFMDRDANGYAYRLVFNHKTEGKLALPWSAQVSDDYIYITIPEGLLNLESYLHKTAKESGEEVINSAKEEILEKFEKIFRKGKDETKDTTESKQK